MSKKILLLASVLSSACGMPYQSEPLTPDEEKIVSGLVEKEQQLRETVHGLLDVSDPMFRRTGAETGDSEDIMKDIDKTAELLQDSLERGKIVGYVPENVENEHAREHLERDVAARRMNFTPSNEDNWILLNLDKVDSWDVKTLMHEAGHSFGQHSHELNEKLATGTTYLSAGVAEQVLDEKDFSYMLTYFYRLAEAPISEVHDFAMNDNTETSGYLNTQERFDFLRWTIDAAPEELAEYYAGQVYAENSDWIDVMGITEAELSQVYMNTELQNLMRIEARHELVEAEREFRHEIELQNGENTEQDQEQNQKTEGTKMEKSSWETGPGLHQR